MTKLIGILFLAAAACASTTAQEARPSDAAPPAPAHTNDGEPTATLFKIQFEAGLNGKPQRDRRLEFPAPGFVINQPQWVVKDGAVYLYISGSGILVPVPGGGASGCFDQNLAERIKKVRSRIEAFPPLPGPAIPRR